MIESETPASSVVVQIDASNLNSRRDDNRSTDSLTTNGWGSLKDVMDCEAENVGVLTLLPRSST